MRNAPIAFRWFGRSLSFADLNARFANFDQWIFAREKYTEGDKIWPFVINPHTMSMRVGFVVVRNGRPVAGIVTRVS